MFKHKSLLYHKYPFPGKLNIYPSKKLNNYKDLSLAYSPGVAFPCKKILEKSLNSYKYTSRGNLVGVLTNGTAVLGLGDIGAEASKPVMEGKSILFKKFANINSIDVEINEKNPKRLVRIIKSLEYTFGGINLEDIKSPECFFVENKCKKNMTIPVFHDDQHGTAIVVCAALMGCLKLTGRKFIDLKVVVSGAGAAATACVKLLFKAGVRKKNVYVFDINGILHNKRNIDKYRKKICYKYRKKTSLKNSLKGCDFFLGLSTGNILNNKLIKNMAKNGIIFALSNPIPEIFPNEIIRKDLIIATGRSDFLNQVNNLLCFPFLFRGVLDIGVKTINSKLKLIVSKEIFNLSKEKLDKKKIITDIFNKKLLLKIPLAIAKCALNENNYRNKNFQIKFYKSYLEKNLEDIEKFQ
ncbi:malic enzyme-like NAD(P)-binding protein [Candidatus Vidania fulgoroideorum]